MVDSISGVSSSSQSYDWATTQTLTDEQKSTLSDILSQYDADNISADDAKSIFSALEDAGISGPGVKEAIEEAGFDADELAELGMPEGSEPPAPPEGTFGDSSESTIDTESLQSLQDILNQYDLSNLTDEDKTALTEQLQAAGFDSTGVLFNIKS